MNEIEYFPLLSDNVYISYFNKVKLYKERSTTVIKKDGNVKHVIVEVLESPYLQKDNERFQLNIDLVENEKINFFLENKNDNSDKINHCELLFFGKRVISVIS